jgi:hypothetical protein
MTKRTVRLGQDWAAALKLMANNAALSAVPNKVLNLIVILFPIFSEFFFEPF